MDAQLACNVGESCMWKVCFDLCVLTLELVPVGLCLVVC